ncbi:hypothetical protein [Gracilimonas sp.]|uniref:hypothetical protein n=1 Tax=Gracilimonas sp. TaxID=1974203 RepID=UPI0032EBA8AB
MSNTSESKRPNVTENSVFKDLTQDVLSLERGLPVTVWHMIKSPGVVIDSYFTDRGRYINPFRYAIIVLAITAVIVGFFVDYEALYRHALEEGAGEDLNTFIATLSAQVPGFDWQKYFDSFLELSVMFSEKFSQVGAILIFAPIMALFSWMFFKSKKEKFVYHYVMMLYNLTTFSIFSSLVSPLIDEQGFALSSWYMVLTIGIMLGFTYYVMRSYLRFNRFMDHVKVIFTFFLGYFGYSILTAFLLYGGAFIYMKY